MENIKYMKEDKGLRGQNELLSATNDIDGGDNVNKTNSSKSEEERTNFDEHLPLLQQPGTIQILRYLSHQRRQRQRKILLDIAAEGNYKPRFNNDLDSLDSTSTDVVVVQQQLPDRQVCVTYHACAALTNSLSSSTPPVCKT